MRKTVRFIPLLVVLFSCHFLEAQKAKTITMLYQETVCPPEWIAFGNDKETFARVKKLFAEDSVEILSIKFSGIPYEMTCAGCACLTGRNLEILIYAKDQPKVEAQQFYKPWVWMDKIERVCDWTMGMEDHLIEDSLKNRGWGLQGLYFTGLSQKKSDDCSATSGRTFTIRIDKEDIEKARKEGFMLNKEFKQY